MGGGGKRSSDWEASTHTTQIEVVKGTPTAKRHVLHLVQGPEAPRDYELKDEAILGRGSDARICISSPDLSRMHVKLRVIRGEVHCEDLESRHGVFLNGVKIHSCVLRNGDTLQAGNVVFTYEEKAR